MKILSNIFYSTLQMTKKNEYDHIWRTRVLFSISMTIYSISLLLILGFNLLPNGNLIHQLIKNHPKLSSAIILLIYYISTPFIVKKDDRKIKTPTLGVANLIITVLSLPLTLFILINT